LTHHTYTYIHTYLNGHERNVLGVDRGCGVDHAALALLHAVLFVI
jgi:hypothetical protein